MPRGAEYPVNHDLTQKTKNKRTPSPFFTQTHSLSRTHSETHTDTHTERVRVQPITRAIHRSILCAYGCGVMNVSVIIYVYTYIYVYNCYNMFAVASVCRSLPRVSFHLVDIYSSWSFFTCIHPTLAHIFNGSMGFFSYVHQLFLSMIVSLF